MEDLTAYSVPALMKAAYTLTHQLHELRPYNGTGPGARKVAETRAKRDLIEAELQRRVDATERAEGSKE